jgi:two-component system OmpR family response regulator
MDTKEAPDHILVVDDDREICELLDEFLTRSGYRVTTVPDGQAMWRALEGRSFDLIVLDLMLPGESGLQLCTKLRARTETPIVMLTARGEETDRIVGLEMGADDYLPKPFNPRELVARIRVILRRTSAGQREAASRAPPRWIRFAGWSLDTVARDLLSPQGVVTPLSGSEFRLLKIFLERPNRVLSRDQLIELSLGREQSPFDRSIDVQVSRLRHRMNEDARKPVIIKTVRNGGYVLAVPVEAEA